MTSERRREAKPWRIRFITSCSRVIPSRQATESSPSIARLCNSPENPPARGMGPGLHGAASCGVPGGVACLATA